MCSAVAMMRQFAPNCRPAEPELVEIQAAAVRRPVNGGRRGEGPVVNGASERGLDEKDIEHRQRPGGAEVGLAGIALGIDLHAEHRPRPEQEVDEGVGELRPGRKEEHLGIDVDAALRMEGEAGSRVMPLLGVGQHGSEADLIEAEGPPRTVLPVGVRRGAQQQQRDHPSRQVAQQAGSVRHVRCPRPSPNVLRYCGPIVHRLPSAAAPQRPG